MSASLENIIDLKPHFPASILHDLFLDNKEEQECSEELHLQIKKLDLVKSVCLYNIAYSTAYKLYLAFVMPALGILIVMIGVDFMKHTYVTGVIIFVCLLQLLCSLTRIDRRLMLSLVLSFEWWQFIGTLLIFVVFCGMSMAQNASGLVVWTDASTNSYIQFLSMATPIAQMLANLDAVPMYPSSVKTSMLLCVLMLLSKILIMDINSYLNDRSSYSDITQNTMCIANWVCTNTKNVTNLVAGQLSFFILRHLFLLFQAWWKGDIWKPLSIVGIPLYIHAHFVHSEFAGSNEDIVKAPSGEKVHVLEQKETEFTDIPHQATQSHTASPSIQISQLQSLPQDIQPLQLHSPEEGIFDPNKGDDSLIMSPRSSSTFKFMGNFWSPESRRRSQTLTLKRLSTRIVNVASSQNRLSSSGLSLSPKRSTLSSSLPSILSRHPSSTERHLPLRLSSFPLPSTIPDNQVSPHSNNNDNIIEDASNQPHDVSCKVVKNDKELQSRTTECPSVPPSSLESIRKIDHLNHVNVAKVGSEFAFEIGSYADYLTKEAMNAKTSKPAEFQRWIFPAEFHPINSITATCRVVLDHKRNIYRFLIPSMACNTICFCVLVLSFSAANLNWANHTAAIVYAALSLLYSVCPLLVASSCCSDRNIFRYLLKSKFEVWVFLYQITFVFILQCLMPITFSHASIFVIWYVCNLQMVLLDAAVWFSVDVKRTIIVMSFLLTLFVTALDSQIREFGERSTACFLTCTNLHVSSVFSMGLTAIYSLKYLVSSFRDPEACLILKLPVLYQSAVTRQEQTRRSSSVVATSPVPDPFPVVEEKSTDVDRA